MATHKTVSGHDIEYEETRELAAFLARLGAVVADPKASVSEAIGLAYSRENPILDQAVFPERGAVTKEVLASPAYAVVSDLIFRKEASAGAYDLEEMAARHTLTVPEVAERLGVHESAVRQAIAARRLPSWVREGRLYIDPAALKSFQVGARGPKPSGAGELEICMGHAAGVSLKVKHPGALRAKERVQENVISGKVASWKRVVVLSRLEDKTRLFVLEPASGEEKIELGPFFVRGRFRIAEKVNNAERAAEAWKVEKAS